MHRTKYIFLVLFFAVLGARAQNGLVSTTFHNTAIGKSIKLTSTGVAYHSLTWNVSGTISACTVALDSSPDGVNWSAGGVIAGQTCTSNGNTVLTNSVVNYVRVNVTTFTGTGTVVVTWSGWVISPGSGSVSGLTTGFIPKASSATTIGANSALDDGVTTPGSVTSSEPMSAPSYQATGNCNGGSAGCDSYKQGTAPTSLDANSILRHAPTSVTAYHEIMPGAAATGIMHSVASTDGNGLSTETDSISAVNLANSDVTGTLPLANGGTNSANGAVFELFYNAGAGNNPLSATTYDLVHFNGGLLTAFDTRTNLIMTGAGTITALYFDVGVRGTLGVRTSGNDTVTVFKNGSTCNSSSLQISNTTMFTSVGPTVYSATGTCTFTTGDIIQIQVVTATFSTAPTTVDWSYGLKITGAN